MKFAIKSEKLEHKDQIIELDKYEGKSVYGKYLGSSRIDELPIFEIDTFQLDREEKISEILK
jgi:hypothetical protein